MCDYVCFKSRCHLFAYKMRVCVFAFTDSPFILIHSFSLCKSSLLFTHWEWVNGWRAQFWEGAELASTSGGGGGGGQESPDNTVTLSKCVSASSSESDFSHLHLCFPPQWALWSPREFLRLSALPHCLTPSTSAASLRSCVLAVCLAVYCLLNECVSASMCLPICRRLVMSSHLSNLVRFFLFFSIDWRAQSVPVFAPPLPSYLSVFALVVDSFFFSLCLSYPLSPIHHSSFTIWWSLDVRSFFFFLFFPPLKYLNQRRCWFCCCCKATHNCHCRCKCRFLFSFSSSSLFSWAHHALHCADQHHCFAVDGNFLAAWSPNAISSSSSNVSISGGGKELSCFNLIC